MQKITINVPDNIHISIIADALAQLDSGITCKPVIKRARITPSESDSVPEYVGQSDLEYLNDWLTVSAFSEWHELTEIQANQLLQMGLEFHEERASNAKGVTA
jgi:hypothetical protein